MQKKFPNNNIMIPINYISKTRIVKIGECLPLIPSSSRGSRKTNTKKIVNSFINPFLMPLNRNEKIPIKIPDSLKGKKKEIVY